MITDRNIVCIASSWFDHPTSKHHVMRHLAQHNHVLWVNFHASRRPRLNRGDRGLIVRRLRPAWRGPRRVAPQLDVLSPLLVPLPGVPWARRINAWSLHRQIRAALGRLPPRPVQLWLFTPDVVELIPRLAAERVVYYCVDDFAAFSGYDTRLMEALEARTLAASDLVIVTSPELLARLGSRHPRVHLVPHGVDFEHFAVAPHLPVSAIPPELCDLPRPVLGYMGLISDYVDLDMLAAAARARPDWSFVLLGDVRCDVSAVTGLPNVHLPGGRSYRELPAWCRGFNVGLIPFRMNRLVRSVNPIKLREYLAAGLPVVSSPMDAVRPYEPAVQIAATPEEFVPACERALRLAAERRASEFQDRVRSEGWSARVAHLSRLVMDLPLPQPETRVRSASGGQLVGALSTSDEAGPLAGSSPPPSRR